MTRVDEIKAAISELSPVERGELEEWLQGQVEDAWDRQMKDDVAGGRLDKVLAKVKDQADQGQLRDLP